MPQILALDQGTTSSRVIVFNEADIIAIARDIFSLLEPNAEVYSDPPVSGAAMKEAISEHMSAINEVVEPQAAVSAASNTATMVL
ncbi:hypothetical protein [Rubellicoccus peritrichatus]|uniref:Carbohydrate kinase FGGY N-terminal domain-containing protein n=1 Tax=Rubellicoccus peritrichatus TaxID=3080537 RepID=A0AAQ3LAC9_9BACT|nr:hypothetical protein [Puniceicoccus sp. CR14]WOO42200.1 hypothetical protein RZN69_03800 [Puniceicoccus sp. CR14]